MTVYNCAYCGKETDDSHYGCCHSDTYYCSKDCLLKGIAITVTCCSYCKQPFKDKVIYDEHGLFGYDHSQMECAYIHGFYCSEECLCKAWAQRGE